ncbi:calcium-translocating P-type ATPase, SERCA-type [Syntrophomonas erecta]
MSNHAWHQKSVEEILVQLDSSEAGVKESQIKILQEKFPNRLREGDRSSPLNILLSQFTDTMVLVLLGATVISGAIGAMADAITIMAIVILNAVLGFVQEYRAERSLEAIKKLASPYAHVIRGGRPHKIPAEGLVPGDIILLEAGDRIPADARLMGLFSLEVDEAALTGESVPVEKHSAVIPEFDTPLADQSNMVFMGTAVTRGRGKAVVVQTGMNTVMGQIAAMMQDTQKTLTPLQVKLDQLGKILIIICIVVCSIVTLLGILRGEAPLTMFMAGVSLAVAAIPEGLPAIVTVVLAMGVQRMARRNAIVRKLPAVETLGCTTVVCSDKTGTLTQNKMTVMKVASLAQILSVEGEGYDLKGNFLSGQKPYKVDKNPTLARLMEIAQNCNNAQVQKAGKSIEVDGDPTEIALAVMAHKAGFDQSFKRISEIPFDSERKRMSVVVEKEGRYYLFTKGALDSFIDLCSSVDDEGQVRPINQYDRHKLLSLQENWANEALRVLGFAYKPLTETEVYSPNLTDSEGGLIMTGICGMIDPPRKGAVRSVQECKQAGIVPIMITGDHPLTARAIGQQIGISRGDEIITGVDIDRLSDNELFQKAMQSRIFARVSPQHKNRIVRVLRKKNHVVAMTGDGVNDAPAIKAADIGISMGITGTEVTKEASAMILADDDFSTIVSAVYEGRAIYDNIRKFLRYLLGCNIGEVMVMFLASLLAMPLPLMPIQILWVNLVTDGLPAMALGLEPPEPGIMKRQPRSATEGIFARGLGWIIVSRGFYIAVITLISFTVGLTYFKFNGINDMTLARTMAFNTLVFAQLFYVFECRSEKISPFELGFFTNPFLIAAVLFSVCMQMGVLYLPFMQAIFNTVPLNWWQWLIILSMAGFKFICKFLVYIWQRVFVSQAGYVTIGSKY